MLSMLLKKQSLGTLTAWSPLDMCNKFEVPGTGTTDASLVDYSEKPATPDQQCIEEVLAERNLQGTRILHVGVGDSSLAEKLHDRCRSIDGITVSNEELKRAESLRLPGYSVYFINKLTRDFVIQLKPGYDIIVDNNPASFSCCRYHFAAMMDNYRWALAPGGELLAAQRGMRWTAGDRRWRMTFDDLVTLGQRFGMRATRLTDVVYSLRRE